jgi:hypothetical protein
MEDRLLPVDGKVDFEEALEYIENEIALVQAEVRGRIDALSEELDEAERAAQDAEGALEKAEADLEAAAESHLDADPDLVRAGKWLVEETFPERSQRTREQEDFVVALERTGERVFA